MQEYLIAESTHSKHPSYHIAERDAHTKLALLCMSYIPAYLKQLVGKDAFDFFFLKC